MKRCPNCGHFMQCEDPQQETDAYRYECYRCGHTEGVPKYEGNENGQEISMLQMWEWWKSMCFWVSSRAWNWSRRTSKLLPFSWKRNMDGMEGYNCKKLKEAMVVKLDKKFTCSNNHEIGLAKIKDVSWKKLLICSVCGAHLRNFRTSDERSVISSGSHNEK